MLISLIFYVITFVGLPTTKVWDKGFVVVIVVSIHEVITYINLSFLRDVLSFFHFAGPEERWIVFDERFS